MSMENYLDLILNFITKIHQLDIFKYAIMLCIFYVLIYWVKRLIWK